jgi:stage III sporulation protein AG
MNLKIGDFIKGLKIKGKPEILIAIAIIVCIGLIFISTENKNKNADKTNPESIRISEEKLETLEKKIAENLSNIKGAGKVRVMVTYNTGGEIVPVFGTDREVSTIKDGGDSNRVSEQLNEQSSPVILNNNGEGSPMIYKEIEPEIRGVIVIAEGAKDVGVQLKLRQAVTTVLNISADKVDVFEMN